MTTRITHKINIPHRIPITLNLISRSRPRCSWVWVMNLNILENHSQAHDESHEHVMVIVNIRVIHKSRVLIYSVRGHEVFRIRVIVTVIVMVRS